MALNRVRSDVSPLDSSVPIVDEKGCPTLQFLRLWQTMFMNEVVTQDDAAAAQTTATTAVTGLAAKADKVTVITAGTALDGGGDLSTDRTIDHADSAVTPGIYGDASNIPVIEIDQQGHVVDISEVAASGGGGGGGGTPTVRASNIQSSSASSYVVSWPTGTVAGDVVLIFVGHGFAVNTPSGWLSLDTSSGANWNGAVLAKIMTSSDITAGSVTVTTGGAFNGVLSAVTIDGTTVSSYINKSATRSTTGATSVSTLPATFATDTDLCLVFLSNRANNTADCTNTGASSLQTISAASASGCVESVSNDTDIFGFTGVGTFSSSGTGYYIASVVFRG